MAPHAPKTLLATLTALALSANLAAARPGDVDPIVGTETYQITQVDGTVSTISLPAGLTILRAKRESFRYGIRLDETIMALPTATGWSNTFCAQFDLQATRHRIAGGGPTGRIFKFNCQ